MYFTGSLIARKTVDKAASLKKSEKTSPKQTVADTLNEDLSGNILVDYGLAEDSANDSDRDLKSSERVIDKLNKIKRTGSNFSGSENKTCNIENINKTSDAPCDTKRDSDWNEPSSSPNQNPTTDSELYDPFETISDGVLSNSGDVDNSSLTLDDDKLEPNTSNTSDKTSDEHCNISESAKDSGSDDNASVNSETVIGNKDSSELDTLTEGPNNAEDSQDEKIKSNCNDIEAPSPNSEENEDMANSEKSENESVKSVSSVGDSVENVSVNSDIEHDSNGGESDIESIGEFQLVKDDFIPEPEPEEHEKQEYEEHEDEEHGDEEHGDEEHEHEHEEHEHEEHEKHEKHEKPGDDELAASPVSCHASVGSHESGEIQDEPGEIIDEPVKLKETRHFDYDRVKFKTGLKRAHSSSSKNERISKKVTESQHLQTMSDSPKKFKSFSLKRERDFRKTKDPNAASAFDKPIAKDEGLYSCLLGRYIE